MDCGTIYPACGSGSRRLRVSGGFDRAGLKQERGAGRLWRIPGLPVLVSATLFFSLQPALAQFSQQGPKLVGTGATEPAQQGWSVSLSSDGNTDGNTAIVGGPGDNGGVGAAWVYTRSGGAWTQQAKLPIGTDAIGPAGQGSSVSLSSDGNTAIVGGPGDNGGVGAAWVYTRTGGVWTQQGSKLIGTGATGAARQGASVSLSADGKTAIVGGLDDDGGKGAAWVFTRSGGVWTQRGSKLVGTGATGAARQGVSVLLSADGNTAIVGGDNDNGQIGAAWVFTRSGTIWTQQGAKLVGTGVVAIAAINQGRSVSLSSDGNTAIVGGPGDNGATGAAWVFTRSGGVWTQQGSKLVGTGAVAHSAQGWSVSLSSDGNTAIVGGPSDNPNIGIDLDGGMGAAWIYTRSGGVWTQQGAKLVGTGAVGSLVDGYVHQGWSVSLSADGNTAIVGGVWDGGAAGLIGAAWVYVRSASAQYPPVFERAIDPMALILDGKQYLIWIEIKHPRVDKVAVQRVLRSMTPEAQKATLNRARALVSYGKAAEKMARFRTTPDAQKAALSRARNLASYGKEVEEAFAAIQK